MQSLLLIVLFYFIFKSLALKNDLCCTKFCLEQCCKAVIAILIKAGIFKYKQYKRFSPLFQPMKDIVYYIQTLNIRKASCESQLTCVVNFHQCFCKLFGLQIRSQRYVDKLQPSDIAIDYEEIFYHAMVIVIPFIFLFKNKICHIGRQFEAKILITSSF